MLPAILIALAAGITVGLLILIWVRRRRFPSIMTHDGRRAWAFMAITGSCLVFTLFAAIGVWLVARNELYTLFLALAAHLQILIGLSAMGFLLGRRMQVSGGRDGFSVNDTGVPEAAIGAQAATDAAQGVTDELAGKAPAPTKDEVE